MTQQRENKDDGDLDALGKLVAEAHDRVDLKVKNHEKDSIAQSGAWVADKLPKPRPHERDGFAHSFRVEDAEEIKSFFDE